MEPQRAPIMVLVTLQQACARLIRKGSDLAMLRRAPLYVVHVQQNDPGRDAPAIDVQALNFLYALSGEVGASMCVLTADVAVTAMANYAAEQGVDTILMGGGERAAGIAETLSGLLPGVKVMILENEDA